MKFKVNIKKIVTKMDARFKDPAVIHARFLRRIVKMDNKLKLELRYMVEKELRKSKVLRALINPDIGVRGYDLPAEFGLRPGWGQLAVDIIMMRLLALCQVQIDSEKGYRIVRGRPSKTVEVRWSFLDPEKYEGKFSGYPFSYISKTKQNSRRLIGKGSRRPKIDWMKWLLNARRGHAMMLASIPSVKEYGINYNLGPKQRSSSRSGRAIMNRNTRRNREKIPLKFFPYSFPEVAKPSAGYINFIDEIARNPKFNMSVRRKMNSIINYYLKPRKR